MEKRLTMSSVLWTFEKLVNWTNWRAVVAMGSSIVPSALTIARTANRPRYDFSTPTANCRCRDTTDARSEHSSWNCVRNCDSSLLRRTK